MWISPTLGAFLLVVWRLGLALGIVGLLIYACLRFA